MMEDVSVKIKKRGPKVTFKLVKSVSLVKMIKTINDKNLSLEEAEAVTHIKPGRLQHLLETDDMPTAMEIFDFYEALSD